MFDLGLIDWSAYGWAFTVVVALALLAWVQSVIQRDVSIVDVLWSLFFLVLLGAYQFLADALGPRQWLVLGLVAAWSLRLAIHIGVRNHGKGEDRRYQKIRENNQPNFSLKAVYLVFGLQAVLAAFIAMPLLAATSGSAPLGWLDAVGVLLWVGGMFFEVVGDAQLARFKADPDNEGEVLDSGLWRYTRHPNYFGEFLLWWGYWVLAVAAGGWWTVLSPLLMSFLLLRVSGVTLLEKDISERRPEYADYKRRTNAFFPGPPASNGEVAPGHSGS